MKQKFGKLNLRKKLKKENMQLSVKREKVKSGRLLVLFLLCLLALLDILFCQMVILILKKRHLTVKSKNFKQQLIKKLTKIMVETHGGIHLIKQFSITDTIIQGMDKGCTCGRHFTNKNVANKLRMLNAIGLIVPNLAYNALKKHF